MFGYIVVAKKGTVVVEVYLSFRSLIVSLFDQRWYTEYIN